MLTVFCKKKNLNYNPFECYMTFLMIVCVENEIFKGKCVRLLLFLEKAEA